MTIKNIEVKVDGAVLIEETMYLHEIKATITNDQVGKTLSLAFGNVQITVPFESLAEYLI